MKKIMTASQLARFIKAREKKIELMRKNFNLFLIKENSNKK